MVMRRVQAGTIQQRKREALQEFYKKQADDIEAYKKSRDSSTQAEIYREHGDPDFRVGKWSQPRLKDVLPQREEKENVDRYPRYEGGVQGISSRSDDLPDFKGPRPEGYWGKDKSWSQLSDHQKAAAMALLEAGLDKNGRPDIVAAKNALGAMINRADKEGQELGRHVSGKIYQPTIEPDQYARLQHLTRLPAFRDLTDIAEQRATGQVEDWVGGATHFLAHPKEMLALEAKDPAKYKNWGPRGKNWTGYDEATGRYKNEVLSDSSHVFLAPEGKHSAFAGQPSAFDYGTTAELSQPDRLQVPFPEEQPSPAPAPQVPELPKLSEFLAQQQRQMPQAQPNDLMDIQSKPISLPGLGDELPGQDDRAFAILPSQQRRRPGGGAPTLPVPRRPPGFLPEF